MLATLIVQTRGCHRGKSVQKLAEKSDKSISFETVAEATGGRCIFLHSPFRQKLAENGKIRLQVSAFRKVVLK
jgi:hypothetical protein